MVLSDTDYKEGDVISFYPKQDYYRYDDVSVVKNATTQALEATLEVISGSTLQTTVEGHYLSTITNDTKPAADSDNNYTGSNINFASGTHLVDAHAGDADPKIKNATFNFTRFDTDILSDTNGAFNSTKFPALEKITFTEQAGSGTAPDNVRSMVVDGDISNLLTNSNVTDVDFSGLKAPSDVTPIVENVFPSTQSVTATVNVDQTAGQKVTLFGDKDDSTVKSATTNAWVHSIPDSANKRQVVVYLDHSIVNNVSFFTDDTTKLTETTGKFDQNIIQLVASGENKGKIDETVTYKISNLTDKTGKLDMTGLHIEGIEFYYGEEQTPLNNNIFKQDYSRDLIEVSSNKDITFKFDRLPDEITSDESVVKYIWRVVLNFLETWRNATINFTDTAGNVLGDTSSKSFLNNTEYGLQTIFSQWVKSYVPINVYSTSYNPADPGTEDTTKTNIPAGSLFQIDVNETSAYNTVVLNPSLITKNGETDLPAHQYNFDVGTPTKVGNREIYDVNLQATFYPAQNITFTSLNDNQYSTTANGYYVALYDITYALDSASDANFNISADVNTVLRTDRSIKPTITITKKEGVTVTEYPKIAYIVMSMNSSEIYTVSKTLAFTDGVATIDLSSISMDMFFNADVTVTVTMDPTTYGSSDSPLTLSKAATQTNVQYAESIVATTNSINTGATMYLSIESDVLAAEGIGIFKSANPTVPGVAQTGVTLNIDMNNKTYSGNNVAQGSAGTVSQLFHVEQGGTYKTGNEASYDENETHKWATVNGSGKENTFILKNAKIALAASPEYVFPMIFQLYAENMLFNGVSIDTLNGRTDICYAYSQNAGFNKLTNVNITTDQNQPHVAMDIDILFQTYGRNFVDFDSGSLFGASAVYVENKAHAGFNSFASKQQKVINGSDPLDETFFDNFQFGLIVRNGSIFNNSYIMSSSSIVENNVTSNIDAYTNYCNDNSISVNDRRSWLNFMIDTCIYVADSNYVAVIHEITDDEIANTNFYGNYAKVSKYYGWNNEENTQRSVIRIIKKEQDIIYKSHDYDIYTVTAVNADAKATYGNDVTASFTLTANSANVVNGTVVCIVNGNSYTASYVTDHWEASIDAKEITGPVIITVSYNAITYTSADSTTYTVAAEPEAQTLVGSKSSIPVSFKLTKVAGSSEITTGTVTVTAESKNATAAYASGVWTAAITLDTAVDKAVTVTVTYAE